jgi:hypothetical protein
MKKMTAVGNFAAALILGFVLAGCGGTGTSDTVTVLSKPENLTATNRQSRSITIAWDAVADAVEYHVYRNSSTAPINQDTRTRSFTDSGLVPSATYTYEVAAVDQDNKEGVRASLLVATEAVLNAESATDEKIQEMEIPGIDTKDDLDAVLAIPPETPLPETPPPKFNSVEIRWPDSDSAVPAGFSVLYNIYRSERDGDWVIVGSSEGTSYTDTTVVQGTTYVYEVRPSIVKKNTEGAIIDEYESIGRELEEITIPEEPKLENDTVAELIRVGSAFLIAQSYDSAVEYFERAYAKDNNDPAAIVYSSIAVLASIARDQKVQDLMKNRFGLSSYPGSIDALLSDSWLKKYDDEQFVSGYSEYTDQGYSWVGWHGEYPKTGGFGEAVSADSAPSSLDWVLDESEYEKNGPGYYRQQFVRTTYVWAHDEPRYNYNWPLYSYSDPELGKEVYWHDDSDKELAPGYYYDDDDGVLTIVSSERKYHVEEWYYDYDRNVSFSWHEAGSLVNEGTAIEKTGYYYVRSEYKLVFVSGEPKYEARGSVLFPLLETPQWVRDNGAYDGSLAGGNVPGVATMQLLLFANLLDKNNNGLNNLLDQTLDAVFGANFEAAADRVAKLSYTQTVPLDAAIISEFGLADIFEGDIVITKVEMDLLIASLRVIKAALEWIDAYDWNTDLNFLKVNWVNGGDASYTNLLNNISTTTLPLKNNFLKDRNKGKMEASKQDFIQAIDAAIGAYDNIDKEKLIPQGVKDEITGRQWIKAGLSALKNAINNSQTFWIPDSEPAGNGWNYSEATGFIGVNVGRLFTPGYLSLDKIIENTNGTPVFYGFPQDGGDPVPVSAKGDIANYEVLGFKFKTDPLYGSSGVVVKVDGVDVPADYTGPLFAVDIAEALWDAYH